MAIALKSSSHVGKQLRFFHQGVGNVEENSLYHA
jgi:hypothetical protein